jgi:branched-chain amino acid aminotransferase
MSAKYFLINNDFFKEGAATLHVSDLSVQRGYGIFDFFKTIDGKAIFLDDHLDRFFQSAQQMHLKVQYSREALKELIAGLMERNDIPDSGIKILLTGGYSIDGFTQPEQPNLIMMQSAFTAPLQFKPEGIKVITHEYQRPLSAMKTLDYSMAIWLQPQLKEKNVNDVVYHSGGYLKETPRANFFIVTQDQEVITAKSDVLSGVIRKNILNLKNSGYQILERDFNLQDLANASEAFITSTTKHILPVLEVDGRAVGNGKAGPISNKLSDLLIQKVKEQII